MAEDKYNMKNPAVKRILQEVKEMQNNRIADYMSLPLEVCLNPFLSAAALGTSCFRLQDSISDVEFACTIRPREAKITRGSCISVSDGGVLVLFR